MGRGRNRRRGSGAKPPAAVAPSAISPPRPALDKETRWPSLILKAIEALLEFLKHHLLISLAGIAALVIVVAFVAMTRTSNECISVHAEHIGEISTCSGHEPEAGKAADNHAYVDPQAGYSLDMESPDNWSVFPAIDLPDPNNGAVAKGFSMPAGIIAPIPVGFLADDAATAFVSRTKLDQGVITLWVFEIKRTGNVEEFIAEETGSGKMRRTGSTVAAYVTSLIFSHNFPRSSINVESGARVHVSNVQISPDHKNALLVWLSPYPALQNTDIVGRFVVGRASTYYIVAIRPNIPDPDSKRFNADIRRMIESLKPL